MEVCTNKGSVVWHQCIQSPTPSVARTSTRCKTVKSTMWLLRLLWGCEVLVIELWLLLLLFVMGGSDATRSNKGGCLLFGFFSTVGYRILPPVKFAKYCTLYCTSTVILVGDHHARPPAFLRSRGCIRLYRRFTTKSYFFSKIQIQISTVRYCIPRVGTVHVYRYCLLNTQSALCNDGASKRHTYFVNCC